MLPFFVVFSLSFAVIPLSLHLVAYCRVCLTALRVFPLLKSHFLTSLDTLQL